jgi:signal transduction histidine kinase
MDEFMNSMVPDETRQEIMDVTGSFWNALAERDVDLRFSHCADFVTFIGTGLDEKASNKQEYIAINKKGVDQYPFKIKMEILWSRLSAIGTMAWVENEVEWTQLINEKELKHIIRNTVVLVQINSRWLIVHVHGSMPDFRLSGQNYMTNAETIKYNGELESEVYHRTRDLNKAMENLRKTQAQLIQSEKMASLGELTAGIAHEIQNPLNFVNNFSEVNSELIGEMKEELSKGNIEEAKTIANDIDDNEKKIIFHGKRADAIVKGMLQHSRSSSGVKESTDINKLADEYLRLAFHGLRAKDKSFNATMKTDFDESIGNINIIPQDIGRVILNLITNAFYATNEKQKHGFANYEPTVTIKTLKPPPSGGGLGVCITVADNGNGIPQKVLDKIFQPFFTTKPTGQGTGLGLSQSYDIIKAHGGEIKVETKEGEGSEFIIHLPSQ